MPWGYRLPQQSACFAEILCARILAFEVIEPHDEEHVRWNDHRELTAGARHTIGIGRHRKSAIAIDPEGSTVYGTPVGPPGRRKGAREFDEARRHRTRDQEARVHR